MKAIDKLIELRKEDPSIVAIAKDKSGEVYYYRHHGPEECDSCWSNYGKEGRDFSLTDNEIEFYSDNWNECIVTLSDIEPYEVKMMSISVQDYERLVQAEKTLENIKKFLS